MSATMKYEAAKLANGDLEKAKAIYAWFMEGDSAAPQAEAPAKPKATKAKPVEEPKAEAPAALDYKADVVPAIIATVARLDAAGTPGDGKVRVRELLESYGVDHGTKLPADTLADFVAKLKAL